MRERQGCRNEHEEPRCDQHKARLRIHAEQKPYRHDDKPEDGGGEERKPYGGVAEPIYCAEGERNGRRIDPEPTVRQSTEPRPFVPAGGDEERDERGKPKSRQEEERRNAGTDQYRGGGDPRGERAAQARFAVASDAATWSLVRPKRRSRARYEAIAWSSACASKSGHRVSVK